MSKFRFLIRAVAAVIVLSACSSLALAQTGVNVQTFVSNTGLNTNDCITLATPCLTIGGATGALSKTKAGGTVLLLSPLVVSTAVTIVDSVTIDGSFDGATTQLDCISGNTGIDGFIVNLPSTFSNVVFKNLSMNGFVLGGSPTATDGIRSIGKGSITVEKCFIYSFGNAGINITTTAGAADSTRLFVRETRMTGNYIVGIRIENTIAGGRAEASLDSVRMENSYTGVGFFGGSRSRATIRDSVASSNGYGGVFAQPAAGTSAEINVLNTTVAYNFYGVSAGGAPGVSTVRLLNTQVLSNLSDGLRVEGGCLLISMGGNSITGNGGGNTGIFNGPFVTPQ